MVIGPLIVVALMNVTFAVLVGFPIVRPVILDARLTLGIGHVIADEKLFPKGRTVNVPEQSTKTDPGVVMVFPSKITLLDEVVTFVPPFLPITVVDPIMILSTTPDMFSPEIVIGPEAAKMSPPILTLAFVLATPDLPVSVIPPPIPVASKSATTLIPSELPPTDDKASPVIEIASADVFAERKVKVPQLASPCAFTLPEPVAIPFKAILPVPEFIVTPRSEIPKDIAEADVFAF